MTFYGILLIKNLINKNYNNVHGEIIFRKFLMLLP